MNDLTTKFAKQLLTVSYKALWYNFSPENRGKVFQACLVEITASVSTVVRFGMGRTHGKIGTSHRYYYFKWAWIANDS